ncbi:unnamed protein product [Calicophoron daubneyi]|uniref:Sec1 family domain-containing protein 1 n=1 Tax=Calicophoron daubneyi TaxID=300641 RepID=A0AAV2TH29_CALDB
MAGLLRGRQIESLKCMLNFNAPSSPSDVPQWKVLIYDQLGRDIISPLLNVRELRSLGVTLHLLLDSPREPIQDVSAIYFVYPSKENILTICKDLESGRYESYYLNFISPISRESLELIAQTALSEDCVQQVSKVYDQYTNFICLEDDLLVLKPPTPKQSLCYYALNRSNATDADIERIIDATVDGLFSVFATLGTVPIIRCARGDASEMVATRLDAKLRDSLRDSRNSLFLGTESSRGFAGPGGLGAGNRDSQSPVPVGGSLSSGSFPNLFQRPLLVLLDRNQDLATPLHHEMTYQSLVHDIFTIRLNRVQVDLELAKEVATGENSPDTDSTQTKPKRKPRMEQYDLCTSTDRLWRDFRGSPFADVAEAIRDEVTTLRGYEKRMGELKSSMGLSGDMGSVADSTLTLLDDNTARLTSAVSSLPQLMERKRCLDMHTNIATCLANVITQRQLHVFAEEEDKIIARQGTADSNLLELIKDVKVGTPEDKLRLILFAALLRSSSYASGSSGGSAAGLSAAGPSGASGGAGGGSGSEFCLSDSELSQLRSALRETYPELDTSAVDYVLHIRRLPKIGQLNDLTAGGLRSSASRSMLNKLVSHGSAIILTGVRHLIGRKSYLPFTRIVSQLMENKGGQEVEDYLYFDPKLYRRQSNETPRFKQPFYDGFVFVIGGGSYVEYQNLLDWVRSTSGSGGTSSSSNLAGMTNGSTTNLSGSGSVDAAHPSNGASGTQGGGWGSRRVAYGCTDLLTPNEFLAQLTSLGKEL